MMFTRRLTLLFLAASALGVSAAEPAKPASKTVRLLTVGNSFSGNATRHLGALAKAAGDTLILRAASVGGSSFEVHWKKVESFQKNPADKAGRYSSKSLKEELTSQPWDVITIQQASIKSHDVKTYQPCAGLLGGYIRKHAPKATLMLHQTWAYRVDDPRFSVKEPKPGEPRTQKEMYDGLVNAYATVAKELGVKQIPVGEAFYLADTDPNMGYKVDPKPFDRKTAKPGQLPDQTHSLHVGWSWKKQKNGLQKLSMDGHHANLAGEYLGACVWYEVLFGKSCVGVPFIPKGLDAEHAKFLQATAHRVVAASR